MTTPTDAAARKALPIARGLLDYFPDALLEVANVSRVGNEQHNPGQPMHWAKEKSTDEADALLRHLIDRGTIDSDGLRHSAKVAWRALALLQRELDAEQAARAEAISSIKAEPWGTGDGPVYGMPRAEWNGLLHGAPTAVVDNRGEWPPDTRVDGRLTCCGQTEHTLTCPQWR